MKVVFLEIEADRDWALSAVGPSCLGAWLREHGHEAELIVAERDADVAAIRELVVAEEPDLIGVSMTTRQWLRGREVVAGLAPRPAPVIAGGLHPTFRPDSVLAAPGFDAVCLGEGERAILEVVEALEAGRALDGIDNVRTGPAPAKLGEPVSPLDRLPWMARDLLREPPGVVNVSTQRGCPFPCTYCAARMLDALYGDGRYGRRRSVEHVVGELQALREGGACYVVFLDDTFTLNPPWLRAYLPVHGEQVRMPFSLHARVETMTDALLELLAEAGCDQITYGVESGSERVRREVMKRPVENARIVDVFERTKAAGIRVTSNYMLGLPDERPEDLDATFELHQRLDPDAFGYFVFYPYPGTPLFETCLDQGLLPPDWEERPAVHHRSVLRLQHLDADDLARVWERFTEDRVQRTAARYGGKPGAVESVRDYAVTI